MADNVVAFDKKAKKDNVNTSEKIDSFVSKNRKPILIIGLIVIIAAIAVCVTVAVTDSVKGKNISAIDAIEYSLTKDSNDIDETAIAARLNDALTAVTPYLSKGGIAGVRANMLAADVSYQKKDFANSRDYWLAAAEKGKKMYTASICLFNAAVCSEELNDLSNALAYYEKASEGEEFLLVTHCLFSAGRVKEAMNDAEGAVEAYQKLVEKYPSDQWTNLAQSRILALKAEGKVSE